MPRPQFTIRALLAAMLLAGVSCWLNRDAPAFATVGAAGAVLLLVGDCCMRMTRESSGMHFAISICAGATSLGAGLWLLAVSVLTALARRATFD